MEQSGDVLINIMADKKRSVAEIDAAFQLFCTKYELRLSRLVEVQCAKLGYSAEIAFKAVAVMRRCWRIIRSCFI